MYNTTQLHPSWLEKISHIFTEPYMQNLHSFLTEEKARGVLIYPEEKNIFTALNLTPLNEVKVVILGQDPYHGEGQAHGLSFSVPEGVKVPPSLLNIYKEIKADIGNELPKSGYLKHWAEQGVLLLNSVLTVEAHNAGSHAGKGWEKFTDEIIRALNAREEPIVFMLWGSYAQKKGAFINESKHLVLKAPHPSPLSAHRGFLGCGHFSKANNFLKKNSLNTITW